MLVAKPLTLKYAIWREIKSKQSHNVVFCKIACRVTVGIRKTQNEEHSPHRFEQKTHSQLQIKRLLFLILNDIIHKVLKKIN